MSARVTLLAGIVSGMAVLAPCFGALYWVLLPQHFPLTRVDLKGDLARTTKAELEAALPRISANFFAADLAEVRASVERLPWVRHWPCAGCGRAGWKFRSRSTWRSRAGATMPGEYLRRALPGKTSEALPSSSARREPKPKSRADTPGSRDRGAARHEDRARGSEPRHAWQLGSPTGCISRSGAMRIWRRAACAGSWRFIRRSRTRTNTWTCATRTASRCACPT